MDHLLQHSKLAHIFKHEDLQKLKKVIKNHTYKEGEIILKKGQEINNVYYVVQGIVLESRGSIEDVYAAYVKHRQGDLVGLHWIKSKERLSICNIYSQTLSTCIVIPFNAILNLIDNDPGNRLLKELWHYSAPSVIKLQPSIFPKIEHLEQHQIKTLLSNSEFKVVDPGEAIEFQNGGIVIEGDYFLLDSEQALELEKEMNMSDSDKQKETSNEEKAKGFHALVKKVGMKSHSYEAHTFIYPDTSTYMSRTPCTVYLFPECLKDMWLNFNTELFEKTLRKIKHADQGDAMKSYKTLLRTDSLMGTPRQLLPNESKSKL